MKISSIVKSPVARRIMSTAMLAAATLGVTNVMAKPGKTQEAIPTQTEVMSPVTAQAAQAYSQQVGTMSSQRNIKLDEKYIALGKASPYAFDVEKEKAEMAKLYQKLGTFGTSFVLQNEINLSALDKMINEMILGAEHWSTETGNKVFKLTDKLKVWYVKQYEPFLYGKASNLTNKKASAEEYSKFIDQLAEETFVGTNKDLYYNKVKEFKSKQTGTTIQKASDLIAYKSYIFSYMCTYLTMMELGIDKAWGMGDLNKVFAKNAEPTPTNN